MPSSPTATPSPPRAGAAACPQTFSDELDAFLTGSGEKTLGRLVDLFEEKAFAVLFVLLLGVPALPVPTGGATHVFEIVVVLVAAQLVAGRQRIWLPGRWRRLSLAGKKQERFITALLKVIRRLERFSRPRLGHLLERRVSMSIFGLVIIALTVATFLAPPFSGLDTFPALGAVCLSLGVLLEDIVIVAVGALLGAAGVTVEIALGSAVAHAVGRLF
jgi:hypothetical protein